MKTKIVGWIMGLVLLGGVVQAEPEDVRWSGGSFDGWDRCAMTNWLGLGGADVSLSSGANQTFDFTAAYGALTTLTITATDPGQPGTITNGGTMRLTVPAAWACRFDTGANVTFGGNALGKVGAAGYTDGGRTLSIPVTTTFVAGDTLTVVGLRLTDLRLVPPDTKSLELDFDGDGARDVYDGYSLIVRALWPGGAYDGWDRCAMAESKDLKLTGGTLINVR